MTHRDCRLGSSHSASAGIPRSWLLCSILKGRERSVRVAGYRGQWERGSPFSCFRAQSFKV